MGRDQKPPIRFPGTARQVPENVPGLSPQIARVQGLIRRAAEVCKGEDPVWDLWVVRHLGSPNGALNGFAGLPMATDAFMRGLHHGLKAHIPIESEDFAAKRLEFSALIARSMIRYAVCDAGAQIIAHDLKAIIEAVRKAEAAFKRLEEIPTAKAPEHPLVRAQRLMGEKIVDLRAAKNRPELPNQAEIARDFDRLSQLYQEMFGTVFPG